MSEPTPVFLLAFLGGTAASWDRVAAHLPPGIRPIPVDLPGFGIAAATPGYGVAAMADHVARVIQAAAPARYLIAGHSMGAKVAAALARRAGDGDPALRGLAGLVLLAGSPPAPEPIDDARRAKMLTWFQGTPAESRQQAETFIDANATRLAPDIRAQLIEGVLQTNPAAWTAWLQHGSREDLRGHIGTLHIPTLILAGADDKDLGPDAQAALTHPHFAHAQLHAIEGARHLLPSEAPAAIAAHIARFAPAPEIPAAYAVLIDGPRTASRLRTALHERARPDDPLYAPRALTPHALQTLRAVTAQILPGITIDFAARLDTALANGQGDGWRHADLPPDTEAMQAALDTLDHQAHGFARQDAATQHALLTQAASGTAPLLTRATTALTGHLSPAQMKHWFTDLTATLARQYAAHPVTLAAMGYSGIAIGGDTDPQGFRDVDHAEPWEPRPTGASA